MPSPSFFENKNEVLDLENCHFNIIKLRCPKCHSPQRYINTFISGKEFITCDYCCNDIPMLIHRINKTVLVLDLENCHFNIIKSRYKTVLARI
jgi:hypothetical protein